MADGTESGTGKGDASGAAAAAAVAGKTGASAAGNGDGAPANNGQGGNGSGDPFGGLETGARDWVRTKGYKGVGDIIVAARSLETKLGDAVAFPGADAKADEWDKFLGTVTAKLPSDRRAPDKADGYEFKLPSGVPEGMPYDKAFADEFKPVAHAAKLTAAQAAAVHDFYVGKAGKYFQTTGETEVKRAVAATTAFESKWGTRDSQPFKDQVDSMNRAVKGLKLESALREVGLLGVLKGDDGVERSYVRNADLGFALAEIGAKLFREGSFEQGGGQGAIDNPFKDGPNKGNATLQNRLWKADRQKAEAMIRAAGYTPEKFGFKTS